MRNVKLSDHAEEQIIARQLDREQVIKAALEPEQVIDSANQNSVAQSRLERNNKLYLLRVVFRDEQDTRLVITAYITSQLKKYWREESSNENTI